MTRAALLDENRLLQADMGHDTIEYKGDEAQPELRGAELAKAVSDKLPASALTVATQIATTLEGLPNDTRLRILDAFAEQYLEAEKTGVRPEQVKLDVSKLKLSKNEMKIVARNVREQANRSIIEKDDPTAEELLALSASQKKYTAKLRLLLANVMSYAFAKPGHWLLQSASKRTARNHGPGPRKGRIEWPLRSTSRFRLWANPFQKPQWPAGERNLENR
jgi:hypothetical protein